MSLYKDPEYQKKYYVKNRAKILAQHKEWNKRHSIKMRLATAKWKKQNYERAVALRKIWNDENKVKIAKCHKESSAKYPLRRKARKLISIAIDNGKLMRGFCEICERFYKKQIIAEAHHWDYSKPLAIQWLCKKHHEGWHTIFQPED